MTCENVCVHFLMAGTHLPQGDFHLLKTPHLNTKNKKSARKSRWARILAVEFSVISINCHLLMGDIYISILHIDTIQT